MFIDELAKIQDRKFSDIHLHEGEPARWRTGAGEIETIDGLSPITKSDFESILTQADQTSMEQGDAATAGEVLKKDQGQTDFASTINGVRYRVSMYWHSTRKLGIAMRKIEEHIPDLSTLGLPDRIYDIIDRKAGLVLVTGETNSGKSTTLAAIVKHLAQKKIHIVTIEDPVEYKHKSVEGGALVTQREVGLTRDTQSFDGALRSALREDPDVILVGEIRDSISAEIAMKAADTGHLVLASLHTRSAPRTVERLRNMFPKEQENAVLQQFSDACIMVLCQALLPSADRTKRVLAYEIMTNNQAITNNIANNKINQILRDMEDARKEGMTTLNKCLESLVMRGEITAETARHASYVPKELKV